MSSVPQTARPGASIRDLPLDELRGIYAMWCVIATEGSLFVCLFCAYFYLGNGKQRWADNNPPGMTYPWIMLAVMLFSAFILRWGEGQVKRQRYAAGRVALLFTILFGLGFIALQYFSYRSQLQTLAPDSNSYGSIFYAISGLHVAHVVVGIFLLAYALVLPRYAPARESPFRPYQTVALYWYFVNFLWIGVFIVMYAIPNLIVHG
ncbi:MAG TPA: heme-copper oxidase subunit III [Bryobacteraceae bacterium]|jgi:heme/copper-type cytochrome/quinol oxidase subunit 3|nr:heme-copper oxidase subunit III [Bryobacteraceae bacterium]